MPKVSENNEADNTAQRAAVDSTQSSGLTNAIATPFAVYPQILNNKVTYPIYPAFVNGNPSNVAITLPIIYNGAYVSYYPHLPITSTGLLPFQWPTPFLSTIPAQQLYEYIPSMSIFTNLLFKYFYFPSTIIMKLSFYSSYSTNNHLANDVLLR